jgi:hypothetical protein
LFSSLSKTLRSSRTSDNASNTILENYDQCWMNGILWIMWRNGNEEYTDYNHFHLVNELIEAMSWHEESTRRWQTLRIACLLKSHTTQNYSRLNSK